MDDITIVIIDSGVNPRHPLFRNDNIEEYIFSNEKNIFENVCKKEEIYGHGTAIYGIIRECKDFARIINIRINNIENGASEEELIAVLNACEEFKPSIINLSLGLNVCADCKKLYNSCMKITKSGCIIVSAFDNAGAISYPAAFDNVIGVISGRQCSKKSDFEYVDDSMINVAAKGGLQRLPWTNSDYILISGNSFACAHTTVQIAKFIRDGTKNRTEILCKIKEISKKSHIIKKLIRNSIPTFKINKAAVFPFNKEMHSLIRYSNLLPFEIVEVFDTKYSAMVGATTEHLMKDPSVKDIKIKSIDLIEWDRFDTLIIGHTNEISSLINQENLKTNLISEAIQRDKYIYSFDDLSQSGYENGERLFFPTVSKNDLPPNRFGMLYRISKPVVGVFGTSSRQGKFTLQLKLRELLLAKGYDVGQIGTEPSALLYGMDYVFPMGYNSSVYIKEFDTVRYLNYIINDLCIKNKDIILVGSQSGTVPYDTGNLVQYTIPQWNFLSGTQPDAVVLCINPYDDYDYIDRTIKFIEACADCTVIALVVFPMNIHDDWRGLLKTKRVMSNDEYNTLKIGLQRHFHLPIFKLGNGMDMEALAELLLDFF